MADVKWIKLSTGLPDNRKIKQIRTLPNGDTIALMWIFLMCLAGNSNDDGFVFFTKEIPYTDEMLAEEFKMDINTIRLGLATFEKFGMLEIVNDFICLSAWEKWQSTDKLSELKEYNRIKQRESRARKRLSKTVNDMSMTSQPCQDIDIELDKDKEKDNNLIVSKDTIRQTDVRRAVEEWNKLQDVGIPPVVRIDMNSQRIKNLKSKLRKLDTFDEYLQAIKNIRESTFLQGDNDRGWIITFKWFVEKDHMDRILGGDFKPRKKGGQHGKPNNTTTRQATPLIPFDQWDGNNDSDTPFV
nr:MAG TPA: replisome organizer [Caudoviricetes sp.]